MKEAGLGWEQWALCPASEWSSKALGEMQQRTHAVCHPWTLEPGREACVPRILTFRSQKTQPRRTCRLRGGGGQGVRVSAELGPFH